MTDAPPSVPTRYVVQEHWKTPDDHHFDLMLEVGGTLWTWALEAPPDQARNGTISGRRIQEHRLHYLTFEGEISPDLGRCKIHDRGSWRPLEQGPTHLRFVLEGEKADGTFELEEQGPTWKLDAE